MIDRRTVMMAALAAVPGISASRHAVAQTGMSRITAYAFSFPGLAGGDIRLAEFSGRPILIVNTASLCGFTPQYGGLQQLWTEFKGRDLMIIGIPSNDFGGQEPGGATEITATAQSHHVTFPIAAKAVVKGPNASVLQMGSRGAAEGCSQVELPQIPDRARRLHRRRIPGIGRTGGYKGQDGHRAGADTECFRSQRIAARAANASKTTHLHINRFGSRRGRRQPLPWRARSN
jgi:glutathione peroxidase